MRESRRGEREEVKRSTGERSGEYRQEYSREMDARVGKNMKGKRTASEGSGRKRETGREEGKKVLIRRRWEVASHGIGCCLRPPSTSATPA